MVRDGRTRCRGAARATLLIFVAALLLIERRSRGAARYHHTTGRYRSLPTRRLSGIAGLIAAAACLLPVALGFLLPVALLARWAVETWENVLDARFFMFAGNSFVLAAISAAVSSRSRWCWPTRSGAGPTRWCRGRCAWAAWDMPSPAR